MVNASFVFSALFALTVAVSAAPALFDGPAIAIDGGEHIGTGRILVEEVADDALQINDPQAMAMTLISSNSKRKIGKTFWLVGLVFIWLTDNNSMLALLIIYIYVVNKT
ncbi:hypothetical protein K501DRAFT_275013 [Backusella circina FSU 941]|nr:hypothetical protein K501DRAFT_275013 [Backusella circina FSU 941]